MTLTWRQAIRHGTMLADAPIRAVEVPFELRDYQITGIQWLRDIRRGALCDQPRLGKTVQAAFASEPPVLIAAPTYLTLHWYDSLISYGIRPDKIALATGLHDERQEALDRPADWYIGNIEMLRTFDTFVDDKGIKHVPYRFQVPRTLIIDEAHHLRGRNSQQSKGALRLATANNHNGFTGAERVYLLTGTPVMNKPDDLFAQLRLLDPKTFSAYWKFVEKYCRVIDIGFGPRVVGSKDPNFYKPLHRLFECYSLTRTAKDVGLKLASLTEQVLRIEPDDDFKKAYKRLKTEYVGRDGEGLDSLTEVMMSLRKMTMLQKLRPLLSLMADTDATTGSIVFCKFKATARALAKMLHATCITGDETPLERRALAQDSLVVATAESISEGCDLSHLHTTIFFELDHVPGVRYQALQRNALSPKPRHCYYLLVRDTIDESIYKANTERTMTIREIVKDALTP